MGYTAYKKRSCKKIMWKELHNVQHSSNQTNLLKSNEERHKSYRESKLKNIFFSSFFYYLLVS